MRKVHVLFCCVLLAGCTKEAVGTWPVAPDRSANALAIGAVPGSFRAPTGQPQSPDGSTFKLLYGFAGQPDGAVPEAPLIDVGGTLYGTTYNGGTDFDGTVFTISPSGTETVVHSFLYGSDGLLPQAGLLDVDGTLYGTTDSGGTNFTGTVFTITPSGTESVLYNFGPFPDGDGPQGGLISVKGTLYGTTYIGGANGYGTVFKITPAGTESVLYSFGAGSDGQNPRAGLIDLNGTLYGTTFAGGASGLGTVFKITLAGAESVLYSFKGSADGAIPWAGLIAVNGKLYGSTVVGGGSTNCDTGSFGCGTIFEVSPSGAETVLHSFTGSLVGGSDGSWPQADLIDVNGKLYGTTKFGGINGYDGGAGTIFEIATTGKERVLYRFKGGSDGADPQAALLNVNGTLYGTTSDGGRASSGTVFSFSL